ncbi:MAG: exodeoxyribonuclease VII small subunit [Verrucomicrobiota bacterium]
MAKQAKKQPKPAGEESLPFEQAIAELEAIVKDMESERMPLDQLVNRYERGNRLLKTSHKRIHEAEQRIEMIATGKTGKSETTLQPFDPAEAAQKAPSPPASTQNKKTDKPEESDNSDDEISLF